MAGYWRGLCPAVNCGRLMMMMTTDPLLVDVVKATCRSPIIKTDRPDRIMEEHLFLSSMDVYKGA
jgi:hypothetical protein